MNFTVLGAAGATGLQVVEQALAAGHVITALARSRDQLSIADPDLRVLVGDATDPAVLSQAVTGADALISVLGARGPVMAEATRAIVSVADQSGPRRVVMLSSFAVMRERLTPVARFVTRLAMGGQIKDKAAGEDLLRASGLAWTVVYATRLTNGPKAEPRVVPGMKNVGLSQTISRAAAASFLLRAAIEDLYPRQGILVTGSATSRTQIDAPA